MRRDFLPFRPEDRIDRAAVPRLSVAAFRDGVIEGCAAGDRLVAFPGLPPARPDGHPQVLAILADDSTGRLAAAAMEPGDAYAALTPDCPQAHLFERELAESWGITPQGHPQPAPVRYPQRPFRTAPGTAAAAEPGSGIRYRVEGDAIHEVAVGPVHAGIIEPGHFRFQCHGETVLHLEIALGYQHRGIQRALIGGPAPRTPHLVETLAGDTSIGHAVAHAQAVEALAGTHVPARAQAWRAIALELERVANHTGDLGALAQDVGYLPTSALCGRIRGDFLNATAVLCGNRFGRGWIRAGGVEWDADAARIGDLRQRLVEAGRDAKGAIDLLWETPSVLARFEETGRLTAEQAAALGLVGPTARACGLERDARTAFPSGYYRFAQIPVSTWATGDVFARAQVRWLEIQRSLAFVQDQLGALPGGATTARTDGLAPNSLAVSLVEGWRGEICHVAVTGPDARFLAYAVVDPSFHNWSGLALALRGQAISDFPLCNKSFNLSYCGVDL